MHEGDLRDGVRERLDAARWSGLTAGLSSDLYCVLAGGSGVVEKGADWCFLVGIVGRGVGWGGGLIQVRAYTRVR
jgi:hypothetical protein